MTLRKRYKETLLFGNPDKIPMYLGLARESTLVEWRKQGLPADRDYRVVLAESIGISIDAILERHKLPVSLDLIPEFEPKILEHKGNHYIVRDWLGAITEISDKFDMSYLKSPKDFVTRKWHKFPVETKEDWQEMKKRFNPNEPGRLPSDFNEMCRKLKNRNLVEILSMNGVFWQLREWCGFENLCILMIEDPDFVHEMVEFWTEYMLKMLNTVLPNIQLDSCFISEDMAYKAHSMISPAMVREFILPAYDKWIPCIKKNGCPLVEIDSDGFIDELIPLWIEAGVNCCSPIEVAAHCDIVEYRRKYGKKMAYLQGIDKRLIAQGGKSMEEHVMKIVPAMLKEGGYIPGCDHGVPPDVSWNNYIEYSRLLAKLCGWL
ncbi:MAG TPA: uroporphyrinogen decarboxylase family protein [Ruminiclostridium sp.]